MSNGIVYLDIQVIGSVIAIWDEAFFKLRVSFDVLVTIKEVFSESSHLIEAHLDVVVEVLEIHSSVSFELYLDEKFIEFFELISYLRIPVPPISVEFTPPHGGSLLLDGTMVVGSGGVNVSFWVGDYLELLV